MTAADVNLMLATVRANRLDLSGLKANSNQRVTLCMKTRCIARFSCDSTALVYFLVSCGNIDN